MNLKTRLFTPNDKMDGHRLGMLTDGIYAIILTLLVLELRIPENLGKDAILPALQEALPKFIAFIIAFNAAATGWTFTWLFYSLLRRSNFVHLMLTLISLMLASLIPFAAAMMGNYPQSPWGYVPYCVIIGSLSLVYAIDALWCGRALAYPQVENWLLRGFMSASLGCVGLILLVLLACFEDTRLALWIMLVGNILCWAAVFSLSRLMPRDLIGEHHDR